MSHLSRNGSFSNSKYSVKRDLTNILALASISISMSPLQAMAAHDSENVEKKEVATTNSAKPAAKGKLIANVQPSANGDAADKKSETSGKDSTASEDATGNEAQSYFEQERKSRKRKYAHSSSTVQINAPQADVWKVLIDFERYPQLFKRIDTCHITKREHGLLYAETYLKPQMFVKKLVQHTVSDISQGPNYLQWKMLDGNFSSVVGSWRLTPAKDKKGNDITEAKYTLEADPGPVIPAPLVSFLLHQVEHEVVNSFKKGCEEQGKLDSAKSGK